MTRRRGPAATLGGIPVRPMLEAELSSAVRALTRFFGWMAYHTHRSDRSDPGWPDEVLIHVPTRRLLVRELKRDGLNPTPAQQQWLDALTACGVDAGVWRPADLRSGEIARALNPRGGSAPAAPVDLETIR